MVCFHDEDAGGHDIWRQMTVRGGEADVRGGVAGLSLPLVVTGLEPGHRQECDREHGQAACQHRPGPPHHVSGDAPPPALRLLLARLEESESATRGQCGGRESQRCGEGDHHRNRAGQPRRAEDGQAGEDHAGCRPGNGEPRGDNDVLHPRQCGVVRLDRVFACSSRLLVSAQKENAVIDSGTQHDHRQ